MRETTLALAVIRMGMIDYATAWRKKTNTDRRYEAYREIIDFIEKEGELEAYLMGTEFNADWFRREAREWRRLDESGEFKQHLKKLDRFGDNICGKGAKNGKEVLTNVTSDI